MAAKSLLKAICRDIYTGKEKYNADGPKKAIIVPLVLEMFQELGVSSESCLTFGDLLKRVQYGDKGTADDAAA